MGRDGDDQLPSVEKMYVVAFFKKVVVIENWPRVPIHHFFYLFGHYIIISSVIIVSSFITTAITP